MIPPTWMIEELERRRREREELERPQLWIDLPEPSSRPDDRREREAPREPIVIELW
jgi:hypothetical protein